MRASISVVGILLGLLSGGAFSACHAQTLIGSDFSKDGFEALGWKVEGDWDVFSYPGEAEQDPGRVARFAASKPEGSLTRTFAEARNPQRMMLSLEYGWGWGEASQPADSVAFMLLDDRDNGYVFQLHRCKATWAVQWAKVSQRKFPRDKNWAPVEIDGTHRAVRDGGGMSRLTITREAGGNWTITGKDWNGGSGASVRFQDSTTATFSKLVLLGNRNIDDQLFNRILLTIPPPVATTAIPANEFLESIGVVTTFPDRGQPLPRTIEMVKYCGFRWVRGGIEGLTSDGPTTIQTYLDLHQATGVKFSWGLVSGGTDLKRLIESARKLAASNALLAFEGNNEPNNWGVVYQDEKGGGGAPSWLAVAKLQRDLYQAVKSDPQLRDYPVWSISESGAETDNVGLQFLTIPDGAGTLLPAGTKFADFANIHNYTYHPASPGLENNKTWNAADPTSACKVDGLYGNCGNTWAKHFRGYSEEELQTLPRVTTETGTTIGGPITETIQGLNLLTTYLDQFKRGWKHTAVYLLRDRTDEAGNQSFGFFQSDYKPRKAAEYLHNLTSILADKAPSDTPGKLKYAIEDPPATVHDLLLQKGDGTLYLIVWNERVAGSDEVTVNLGRKFNLVTVYDPTVGTDAVQTHAAVNSLTLTLSDHPLILAIHDQ